MASLLTNLLSVPHNDNLIVTTEQDEIAATNMLHPTTNCKLFLHFFHLIANYLTIDSPPPAPEPADIFDGVVDTSRHSVKITTNSQSNEALSNSATAVAVEILQAMQATTTPAERIAKSVVLGGVLSLAI